MYRYILPMCRQSDCDMIYISKNYYNTLVTKALFTHSVVSFQGSHVGVKATLFHYIQIITLAKAQHAHDNVS